MRASISDSSRLIPLVQWRGTAIIFERTVVKLRSVDTLDGASFDIVRQSVVRQSDSFHLNQRYTEMSTRKESPIEAVIETVSSWPGITTGDGRFNSTTFQLAGNEIGHLHLRLADIGYPKPLRDQLIAEDHTQEHHVVPNHPNATTFRIESADDIDHVVWLFRLSYLARLAALQKRGEMESDFAGIDVQEEVAKLAPSDELRRAFEAAVAT